MSTPSNAPHASSMPGAARTPHTPHTPEGSDAPHAPEPGAALALAFDVDGPTGDAMIEGSLWRKPGYFCLGAYGPHRAVPRILDILQNLGLHATFFTPSWVVEEWPELARRIVASGHEVACHGHRHEMFFGRGEDDQRAILRRAQDVFRRELGVTARGFRAPSGDWHPRTADLLDELGFVYSSSLRNGDAPFRHDGRALIELPAKSLFDDYTAFAYYRAPNYPAGLDRVVHYGDAFATWGDEVQAAADEGATATTIWHPKVIATPGRALMLEAFLADVRERIPVRTCGDVVRRWSEEHPR